MTAVEKRAALLDSFARPELSREEFTEVAMVLSRLLGDSEPLDDGEAAQIVHLLLRISPDLLLGRESPPELSAQRCDGETANPDRPAETESRPMCEEGSLTEENENARLGPGALCDFPNAQEGGDIPRATVSHGNAPYLWMDLLTRERSFAGGFGSTCLEESFFKPWTGDESHPLHGTLGLAWGDPAAHMLRTLDRFGIELDPHGDAAPDHAAILLEFLAFLLANRPEEEVISFCKDHLDWLPELRRRAEADSEVLLSALVAIAEGLVELIISHDGDWR